MEDKELHHVVQLLLARMESHPEEFKASCVRDYSEGYEYGRWESILDVVYKHASEVEVAALDAGLRPIALGGAHEVMMDELLNGPERRRLEEEKRDTAKAQLRAQLANQTVTASAAGTVNEQYSMATTLAGGTINKILGALK